MAAPVWTLSVDLQTKTATFTSGLADAAKGARGSFNEIKEGAAEMGASTGHSMTEARHSVMLLGEEFGVHLPRALTSFIASIGPIGEAMEAAFPFLAIVVGATLLLEHLSKLKAEGDKLTESQLNFGTTTANVLNGLNDKLLQAGIRADELNGNHLAALNKELQLIDRQSMNELVKSFDAVAKAADLTFAQIHSHWYTFGAGADGAKASLEHFKADYESLLAQGKDKEALELLDAKIAREQTILNLQKQATDSQSRPDQGHKGDYAKYEESTLALKKMGVGYTHDEITAQEMLVGVLRSQVDVTAAANALKTIDKSNAGQTTENKMSGDSDKAARDQAQAQRREAEATQKAWEENYRSAVSALQESERQKIGETEKGSAARLAAIDAAIKEENSKGLQETGFYKTLLADRVNVDREMRDEKKKLDAEAGKEEADHVLKMGQLGVAATRDNDTLLMSARRVTDQQRMAEAQKMEDAEFQLKAEANTKDIAALDKTGKDYENKLKQLQNKELELVRAHQNAVTQITNKATEERNARELAAQQHMDDAIARGLTQTLMRHESFAKMVTQLGDQMIAGMMETAIKSVLANDFTKESDAAAAARKAYNSMASIPYIGPALGAAAAASAFTMMMAFEDGGIVPGVGNGDTVPAMLTPGEAVLPKNLTEGLTNAARNGNLDGGGGDVHVHHHMTSHIHAIDGASVKGMLEKHADVFARHVDGHIRKLNR
jgi:hypothetical protein